MLEQRWPLLLVYDQSYTNKVVTLFARYSHVKENVQIGQIKNKVVKFSKQKFCNFLWSLKISNGQNNKSSPSL